jgi:tetratricopeptide (TPR) repeat protein
MNVESSMLELDREIGPELRALFRSDDILEAFKGRLKDFIKEHGAPGWVAKLGADAICSTIGFGIEKAGDEAREKLLVFAGKIPGIRKLLAGMIADAKSKDEGKSVKASMLAFLQDKAEPLVTPADEMSGASLVQFLYERRRHEKLLATLEAEIAAPLRDLSGRVGKFVDEFYEPVLDDPRRELHRSAHLDSLIAHYRIDRAQPRAADEAFLRGLLEAPDQDGQLAAFRWALLTGPGGSGKTRLALEFLAGTHGFRAGFLKRQNLPRFDPGKWRPSLPTLIIVDYPAEAAEQVAALITGCLDRSSEYGFAVRILLLEREATGEWFKKIDSADGAGGDRRGCCFQPDGQTHRRIAPLDRAQLLAILRGRLPEGAVADAPIEQCLLRVDPPSPPQKPAPRPLFAAATGLLLAEQLAAGKSIEEAAAKLRPEDVFERLLAREREHFWLKKGDASDDAYENLLLLATMTLGVTRKILRDRCPDSAKAVLPALRELDGQRYARMAGGDPEEFFAALQPDLVGEYFVLSRLSSLPEDVRQDMIDAAWAVGGFQTAQFAVRAANDFGEIWRGARLNLLTPSGGGDLEPFAAAMVDITATLPGERIADMELAIQQLELYVTSDDAYSARALAMALFNKGVRLGQLGQSREAIEVYDQIGAHFDDDPAPAIRELVAMALFNKGVALGQLGQSREEIEVYDEIDARFGDDPAPAIREQVAKALVNKGVGLGQLGQSREAIEVYDQIVARFSADLAPAIREQVAMALRNKGVALEQLGQSREAIEVFDRIDARFSDDPAPAIRAQVAQALVNKGISLGQLGQSGEAIEVFGQIDARFGDDPAPAIREQVAKALFNKGVSLLTEDCNQDATKVFSELLQRFSGDPHPAIQDLLAEAKDIVDGDPEKDPA